MLIWKEAFKYDDIQYFFFSAVSTKTPIRSSGSYNKLDITVKVDGDIISLKIDRPDEQHIRTAAYEVNRILALYKAKYGNEHTSDVELLRYTALHFAAQVEEMKAKEREQAVRQRLELLKEKLDTALYPHPKE